jgi:hypothetical protein
MYLGEQKNGLPFCLEIMAEAPPAPQILSVFKR